MILSSKLKVDKCGKVTIPAEYRRMLDIESGETFVLISCDTDMEKIEIKKVV